MLGTIGFILACEIELYYSRSLTAKIKECNFLSKE